MTLRRRRRGGRLAPRSPAGGARAAIGRTQSRAF